MKKLFFLLLFIFILSGCKAADTAETLDKTTYVVDAPSNNSNDPANPPSSSSSSKEAPVGSFSKNEHFYNFDVVTGATQGSYSGESFTGEEKRRKMYWSGRPEVGSIKGDYYHESLEFDGGYLALLDVVKSGDQLKAIEFDERASDDYYSTEWAGKTKRLSGYAEFQAENNRTDVTLVTVVNAMTFLEHQMLTKNTLTGEFYSVKGASNSVRNGYIPVAKQMAERLTKASSETYYGITKTLQPGLYGRLSVIKDKSTDKINKVHYDEYFGDSKEAILDPSLKPYFRQSKYYSRTYSLESGQNFKIMTDELTDKIVASQNLRVESTDELLEKNYSQFIQEMENFLKI